MKKRIWLSYFILAFLFFIYTNMHFQSIENIRGPFFGFEDLFASSTHDQKSITIASLKSENIHLKKQIEEAKKYLSSEEHIESIHNKCLRYDQSDLGEFSSYYKRRLNQMINYLSLSKWQLSANIIYREPANWNSAIWIDIGTESNTELQTDIVAINSPVIIGEHLIGLIEKVDKHKSLVRLITDSRVTPSVRCVRGGEQESMIKNYCIKLKDILSIYNDHDFHPLIKRLDEQISKFDIDGHTQYLGKGYLVGTSHPIWRSRSLLLNGYGFNYNYGDEEGPPKFLYEDLSSPLFQKGDALLTTGMDGIFPPNLLVGFVETVSKLKEGAVTCELKAMISYPEFSDMTQVTVLPPVDKDM